MDARRTSLPMGCVVMEVMSKSERSWHCAVLGSSALDVVLLHGGDEEEQEVMSLCSVGVRRHGRCPHHGHHGYGPLQASVVMGDG
jgi:hypothetical protein